VVGGEEGGAGAVDAEVGEAKVAIVIEMVEVEDGEESWVSPGVAEKLARMGGLKGFSHETGSQTVSPFVEISHNDFRSCVFLPIQYLIAEQNSGLMTAFGETRPEVNIEQMKHDAIGEE
jgi:hypothetical protein